MEAHKNDVYAQKIEKSYSMGCGLTMLGIPVVGTGLAVLTGVLTGNVFWGFLGFAVGATLVGAIGRTLMKKLIEPLKTPKNEEERLLREGQSIINSLRKMDSSRKLYKNLDPVAGQLLEAGAYHWLRIHDQLRNSAWQSDQMGGHWIALKEKSENAANIAMAELLAMCSECVGEPDKDIKDDWQDVLEDFVELDIQDALQGLSKMSKANPEMYRFHSPKTKQIFDPARQVAERLKELADLVEENTQTMKLEVGVTHEGSYSRETIEVLLSEFKAVKQAEEELQQGN